MVAVVGESWGVGKKNPLPRKGDKYYCLLRYSIEIIEPIAVPSETLPLMYNTISGKFISICTNPPIKITAANTEEENSKLLVADSLRTSLNFSSFDVRHLNRGMSPMRDPATRAANTKIAVSILVSGYCFEFSIVTFHTFTLILR